MAAATKGTRPAQKYKFVVWRPSREQWVAKVRVGNRSHFLGSYEKDEDWKGRDAAWHFLRTRFPKQHASKDALLLPVPRSAPGAGTPGLVVLQRTLFRTLVQPYQMWGSRRGEKSKKRKGVRMPLLPGDAEDIHRRAAGHWKQLLDHPGLRLPALLTKMGPDRDAMHQSFIEERRRCRSQKRQRTGDPCRGEEFTFKVLQGTVRRVASLPNAVRQPWINVPGHNTSFHGGLAPYAAGALGLMSTTKGRDSQKNPLRLGKQRRRYWLKKSMGEQVRRKLALTAAYGQVCKDLPASKHFKGFAANFRSLQKAIKGVPGVSDPTAYRRCGSTTSQRHFFLSGFRCAGSGPGWARLLLVTACSLGYILSGQGSYGQSWSTESDAVGDGGASSSSRPTR